METVEITSLDLRYETCRMKNPAAERSLLNSICEGGIQEPLQGVATNESRLLLDGFKRYRCAKKLGLGIVPYASIEEDAAAGIIR
jgi:ParB-like chromosome segregation protein Spo0J